MPTTAITSTQILDSGLTGRQLVQTATQSEAITVLGLDPSNYALLDANNTFTGLNTFDNDVAVTGNINAVDGDFSGTLTVDTVNASGSTLDLQLGGSSVLKANSSFSYYYGGGGNTYILQGSDFLRPQGGAAPFDLGGASHRWRTVFGEDGTFSGNLNSEVGGTQRIYNLGTDGDADTEYLETSWDTNVATISTENTGAGVKRNFYLGDSTVPKLRLTGARVEIVDGLSFAAVFDSSYSTFYGLGIKPVSNSVQECGSSSARWANVHSVDGDFSGTVDTNNINSANGSFSGNLNTEVGGSRRLYKLGTEGDTDTEFLETLYDTTYNTYSIRTGATGSGTTIRSIYIGTGFTGTNSRGLIISNSSCTFSFGGARLVVKGGTIDAHANFSPSANNLYDLGSDTKRWANIYSVDGNFSGITTTAGFVTDVKTVTSASDTLVNTDHTVLCDCSSNAITINLPTASAGQQFVIKKVDSTSDNVTILPNGSETIDGTASVTLIAEDEAVTLVSDGSGWFISSEFASPTGGNPFDQSLNTADSPTFSALSVTSISGDGSALTNLPQQNNQSLNTTDDVTFNSITGDGSALTNLPVQNNQALDTTSDVTFNSVSGDGSGLTGVPSSNHFDQSLNTTDSPTFNALTVTSVSGDGSGLTNLPEQNNQDLDTTSDVTFNSVSGDGSGLTNVPSSNHFNQSLNTTDAVTFSSITGDGSALTNLPVQNNQALDTTSDVTFNSVSGDGSGLTGVPSSNHFDQSLNTTDDVTFNTITGDGSSLTNLPAQNNQALDTTSDVTFNSVSGDGSGLTGVPSSNHFNQSLNTTDDVTFDALTVTSVSGDGSALTNLPAQNNQSLDTTSDVTFNSVSGDGSGLTGVPSSNHFDQSLNTTDSVTFNTITGDGSALTNLPAQNNQSLDTTSDVTFNSVSGDGSGLTGVPSSNHFNQSLNTTDAVTFSSITGDGSALTNLPVQNNQSLDTTDDVTFNSVSGDGSGLTGVPSSNHFDQSLNTTDSPTFNALTVTSVSGDGSALTNLPAQNNQALDTTSDVTFNSVSGDGSGLTGVPSSNHFNQSLNTTDSPTFAALTVTSVSGDGSGLTGVPSSNHFNQSLNTTDDVTFDALTVTSIAGDGSALTNLPAQNNQSLDTTSDVTFNSVSGDGSGLTGVPSSNHFDQSLNTTDSPTFASLTVTSVAGDGSALTNLPAQNNQALDTTSDVTFNSITGDGSGLTGVPSSNHFDQSLNTTDSPTFNALTVTSVTGDGSGLTNVPSSNHFDQDLNTTDSPSFVDGDFSGIVNTDEVNSDTFLKVGGSVGVAYRGLELDTTNGTLKWKYNNIAKFGVDTNTCTISTNTLIANDVRTDNIRPLADDTYALGESGFRWSDIYAKDGSFTGSLTSEVGGSYKLYNLGDESAADTEYLEISATANEYFISPKETGTGARRDLFVAGSYAATRSHLEFQNNGNLRIAYGSTANVLVGGGYVQVGTNLWPTTDNAVTCGKAANRWSTVYGVDGDFSGTVTTDTIAGGQGQLRLNEIANQPLNIWNAAGTTQYYSFRTTGIVPKTGAESIDVGNSAAYFKTAYIRNWTGDNLTSEVGGSYKLYNLGADGDTDTEYLETSWDTNVATIETKATGSGFALRELRLVNGGTSLKLENAALTLRSNNTNILRGSGSSATYLYAHGHGTILEVGNGEFKPFSGTVALGSTANRWSTVYGVDADFSGNLTAPTVTGVTRFKNVASNWIDIDGSTTGTNIANIISRYYLTVNAAIGELRLTGSLGTHLQHNLVTKLSTTTTGVSVDGNLNTEVGGSHKLYNLGTEGDTDTEFGYVQMDAGTLKIGVDATGSGSTSKPISFNTDGNIYFKGASGTPTRLDVASTGIQTYVNFSPNQDRARNLGSTTSRFARCYVNGGMFSDVETVTAASKTVSTVDSTLLCDCTSNSIAIDIPTSSAQEGNTYVIKKIDSTANTVTITPTSRTIDGATSVTLQSQFQSVTIVSDGSNWFIV